MENDFHDWLANHWPTLVAKVGHLEGMLDGVRGQQKILLGGMGLLVVLMGTLIALVVKGG